MFVNCAPSFWMPSNVKTTDFSTLTKFVLFSFSFSLFFRFFLEKWRSKLWIRIRKFRTTFVKISCLESSSSLTTTTTIKTTKDVRYYCRLLSAPHVLPHGNLQPLRSTFVIFIIMYCDSIFPSLIVHHQFRHRRRRGRRFACHFLVGI